MITLQEAIKIAERERDSKVVSIVDCDDRWAFTFENDRPKECNPYDEGLPDFVKRLITCPEIVPTFVFKNDGHSELFYISEHVDLLANGTEITLSKS